MAAPPDNHQIFIGNLPSNITDADIREIFKGRFLLFGYNIPVSCPCDFTNNLWNRVTMNQKHQGVSENLISVAEINEKSVQRYSAQRY